MLIIRAIVVGIASPIYLIRICAGRIDRRQIGNGIIERVIIPLELGENQGIAPACRCRPSRATRCASRLAEQINCAGIGANIARAPVSHSPVGPGKLNRDHLYYCIANLPAALYIQRVCAA